MRQAHGRATAHPLLLVTLLLVAMLAGLGIPTSATTTHAPIAIDGDADFAAQAASEGWPGAGTAADPYIIEGYTISAVSATGIQIENTRVHFILRDNTITGNGGSTYGIYLSNVQYGQLSGNTISRVVMGIFFNAAADNEVYDTQVTQTVYGYALISSLRNHFENNSVVETRHAYYLLHSRHNVLENNTARTVQERGVYIHNGEGNHIGGTTIEDATSAGVYLLATSGNVISRSTITNTPVGVFITTNGLNRVDNSTIVGVPKAIHLDKVSDATLNDNNITGATTGLDVNQAKRTTLHGNRIQDTKVGMNLFFAEGSTVRGGSFHNVTTGLLSTTSPGLKISDITITSSGTGIHLKSTRFNMISGLDVRETTQGVRIDNSRDNTVEESVFVANTHSVIISRGLKMEVRHNRFYDSDIGLRILDAQDNLIWNNVFANPRNVEVTGNVQQQWSVEKTPGRNIIGGKYLGGNWWHDYQGKDLNADGHGETPHSIFAYGRAGSEPVANALGAPYGPDDTRPLTNSRLLAV